MQVAQHVLVVGGEREYLACLLCLATLPDAENLDAPVQMTKTCSPSFVSKHSACDLALMVFHVCGPPLAHSFVKTGLGLCKTVWQ